MIDYSKEGHFQSFKMRLKSFKRLVAVQKSQSFKISCLEQISRHMMTF